MINLPVYTSYSGEKSIALLDNSAVAFLEILNRNEISIEELLKPYDLIFVPNWVLEEINDSEIRSNFMSELIRIGYPLYSIAEENYADLIDEDELNLYKIINASVSSVGQLIGYIRKNVAKPDLLDLEDSHKWISEMYANWPIVKGTSASGRELKKNAGEISITVLAEIFSWFYPELHTITVYTQDSDSWEFQKNAEQKLKKNFSERLPVSVSYKSNDFILCQLFRLGKITEADIRFFRKDERNVTYTILKSDSSIGLQTNRLNTEKFIEYVKNPKFNIIY